MSPIAPVLGEQRTLLSSVSWITYEALADESTGNRLTYDQGDLEIMSPMMPHETAKRLLTRMIDQFTMIRDLEIRSAASTTFRRADLARGFEADESYYVQNAAAIRNREQIDLMVDPPPDLVIEIEISRSAINQLDLFAAFGIPEVWRYDNSRLRIHLLTAQGYASSPTSVCLPNFPLSTAESILARRVGGNETQLIQEFTQACQSMRSSGG